MNPSEGRSVAPARRAHSATGADVSLGTTATLATLSSVLAVLRRRRRACLVAAIAGVSAGIALSLVFPPHHTATTTLLLQHASREDPADAMATDAELLKTRTVARAAIDSAGLRVSPRQLVADSRVTVLTADILQLTVTGPSSAAAVRRAAVLADAFLAFRQEEYERQSKVEVAALQERANEINTRLTQVNDAVNAFPARPDARTESGLRQYGDLLGEKATLTGQLGELHRRIDAASVAPASSVVKSRVLDPAISDERSPLRSMATNSASGLVAALAIGVGWVVLQGLVSDKLRTSEEVAAALQAPVALTTGRLKGSSRRQRRRLRKHSSPPADVARVVRKWHDLLLRGRRTRPTLAVLSVGDPVEAAHLVACTVRELVLEGRDVLVADLSDGSVLAKLFSVAPRGTSTVDLPGSDSSLTLTFPSDEMRGALDDGDGGMLHRTARDADLSVVLMTATALTRSVALPFDSGTTAVTVVRAGAADADSLRSTRRLLEEAGLKLDHAVVVGADAGDGGVRAGEPVRRGTGPTVAEPLALSSGEST